MACERGASSGTDDPCSPASLEPVLLCPAQHFTSHIRLNQITDQTRKISLSFVSRHIHSHAQPVSRSPQTYTQRSRNPSSLATTERQHITYRRRFSRSHEHTLTGPFRIRSRLCS